MGLLAGIIVAAIVFYTVGITEKNVGYMAGAAGWFTKLIVESLLAKKTDKQE